VGREAPYITVEAESALDSRWTAPLWFAWSRVLSTCRLKRACTAESWPAAVLELRTHEAASILAVHANKVRSTLDLLSMVASISVRSHRDHGGDLWTISVDNYAKYQKLGRPTSATTYKDVSDPPHVPTSLRKKKSPDAAASPPLEPVDEQSPDPGLALVEPPRKREPPDVPPDAAKFADDFRAALIRVHDGFKPPTPAAFESWRQAARLMLATDKRPPDEARQLAAWLFAGKDEGAVFWRSVVLSVPKFRDKYDQLLAKARANHERGQGAAHHGSALLAWANS